MKVAMFVLALATLTLPAAAAPHRPPLTRDPFQLPNNQPTPVIHHDDVKPHPQDTHVAAHPDTPPLAPVTKPVEATLMGVLHGQHPVALLVQHNRVVAVHEGDRVGTARVTAIHNDRVDLQNGADHVVMLLHPVENPKSRMPCGEVLG